MNLSARLVKSLLPLTALALLTGSGAGCWVQKKNKEETTKNTDLGNPSKPVDPPKAAIGKPAPDFTADAVSGKPVSLADLKGKVVLLDFWAVWCVPCIKTFPHLREWDKEYRDQGLEIVGLTQYFGRFNFDKESGQLSQGHQLTEQQEQEMLRNFAQHHKLDYRLLVMSPQEWGRLNRAYSMDGIPFAAVIDRKGVLRMMKTGASPDNTKALAEMIKKLIAEKE